MLVYHPAFDTYHCIIRLLKIFKYLRQDKYEVDRIRIYDYYFLFINDLENVILPRELSRYKNLITNNKYNRVLNPKYIFTQLESVQQLAFKALTSYGFVDKDLFNQNFIKYTGITIPDKLLAELTEAETHYIEIVTQYFETINIRELKRRTKLMDYRYELS